MLMMMISIPLYADGYLNADDCDLNAAAAAAADINDDNCLNADDDLNSDDCVCRLAMG